MLCSTAFAHDKKLLRFKFKIFTASPSKTVALHLCIFNAIDFPSEMLVEALKRASSKEVEACLKGCTDKTGEYVRADPNFMVEVKLG